MSKPSEKAMQCVYSIRQQAYTPLTVFLDEVKAAELIDAHTAEALAEHKRVIEMAEKALRKQEEWLREHISTPADEPSELSWELAGEAGELSQSALAEIAKLRKE